jgi:hypothetical protein
MHGITALSLTLRSTRARVSAAVAACALVTGCSQTPASPTLTPTGAAATTDAQTAQGTSQSWQDFDNRGWHCRNPAPAIHVCSPPNQPVAFPPPEDRPGTVMLKRWINGVFDANVLWIRPELYHGQICGPTGDLYRFLAGPGYYECVHPVGN